MKKLAMLSRKLLAMSLKDFSPFAKLLIVSPITVLIGSLNAL
jgi:hypothetical protein